MGRRPEQIVMNVVETAYKGLKWWMGATWQATDKGLSVSIRGVPGSSPFIPSKINGVPITFTTKARSVVSKRKR
jgi:hypothetical protein